MILAGQQFPNPELAEVLGQLASRSGVVVLREHLSNLDHPRFCSSIDLLMPVIKKDTVADFVPELLISFGGQLVSKSLKQFLRQNRPSEHWHLSLSNEHFDTYRSLTRLIGQKPASFFSRLAEKSNKKDQAYLQRWKEKELMVNRKRDDYIRETVFSDLKVFRMIRSVIPENSVVHLGNSSPVRYALTDDAVPGVLYLSNRGTAGIDGPLSTAAGYASASEKLNTVILGDLSFFYDSNALWNNYIGKNLRVIVIHNGGGNIFSMIKGPEHSPAFREHFFTENRVNAEGIAKTFGLNYSRASDEEELKTALADFYRPREQAALLEVFTDAETNSRVFRGLFAI